MEEPLFDNLRTKQQIGYMVQNELSNLFGILAFSITIAFQSSKFTADEVDNRIETFLKNFLKTLKSMSEEEWEETKSSLCSLLSCADLEIGEEVSRNFSEICSDECLFDRPKRKASLQTIVKNNRNAFKRGFYPQLKKKALKFKSLNALIFVTS